MRLTRLTQTGIGRRVKQAAGSVELPRPHWPRTREAWAYVALIAVALATRLWDLGGRSLHYDEILHAWYSWRFAEGIGYSHTPLTHGPFLYHAGAATYSLLGASDLTARLLPALFGVALVGLPYALRRELGRYGALATAAFLLVSPSLLYFGRFMRNDIYMAVWALALAAVIFRYRERPRTWLLFAWAVLWAFAFSTKESAYLLAGTFGLFLLIVAAPALWEWAKSKRRLSNVGPEGDLFVVLGTLTLPLFAPLVGLAQGVLGIVLVNPDPNDPRVRSGELARAAAETGAPADGALFIAAFLVLACGAIAVMVGRSWDRRRWPLLAAAFIAVWLPLFTSMFTNWQGFFTGLWGSLGYWMAQQGVERANQPMHYYVLGLATYEFLVVVPAIAGSAWLLARSREAFDRFIVGWAALAFALFTIAGERMPWLLVGITLPLAVVAGRTVGLLLERAAAPPRPDGQARGRAFGARLPAWIALGALALAAVGTAAVAVRASYSYEGFERPRELLVYSQTGQETKYAAECIARLAGESGLGRDGLRILVDESDTFVWQWRWYLRDYPWTTYQNLREAPLDAESGAADSFEVAMMSRAVEAGSAAGLEGFERVGELRHLWWFPNYAYNRLTLSAVLSGALSREGWGVALDYFIDREFDSAMQSAFGVVYVRSDLAGLAPGCAALRASPPGS